MVRMTATTVLEFSTTGLQVSAGWADTDRPDVRFLLIGVPQTHDSVRLDWYDGTDFAGEDPVCAWLTVGTLPVREVRVCKGEIVPPGPARDPRFGPSAAGILRAVAEPLTQFAAAHPGLLHQLTGRLRVLFGKWPKDIRPGAGGEPAPAVENPFGEAVIQYRAAGAALGGLVADPAEAAVAGAVLGSLVGVSAYLTD
jgi:hypothetical protein